MFGAVITIHPDGRISAETALQGEARLGQLQKAVGGAIEPVGLFDTFAMTRERLADLPPAFYAFLKDERRPCIAYCDEDGKLAHRPLNKVATVLWAESMVIAGHATTDERGMVSMSDVLVGPIAILVGDEAISEELE